MRLLEDSNSRAPSAQELRPRGTDDRVRHVSFREATRGGNPGTLEPWNPALKVQPETQLKLPRRTRASRTVVERAEHAKRQRCGEVPRRVAVLIDVEQVEPVQPQVQRCASAQGHPLAERQIELPRARPAEAVARRVAKLGGGGSGKRRHVQPAIGITRDRLDSGHQPQASVLGSLIPVKSTPSNVQLLSSRAAEEANVVLTALARVGRPRREGHHRRQVAAVEWLRSVRRSRPSSYRPSRSVRSL